MKRILTIILKAAANWLAAQGFESYDKWLFGIGYDQKLGNHWTLNHLFLGIKSI
jgi:iron complex outermembrane receptor protein